MNKLVRFLMPIVIAVVLGPLIAGLAVGLAAVVTNVFDYAAVPMADVLKMSGFYIVFSYFIGGPVAILAGLLVSIWMISRPPSFFVVIGAAVIATTIFMGVAALGFLGVIEYTNARSNFLSTLVLAIIAAAGCWLLTRRFARVA
jgi:hypothetical protein